MRCFLPVAFMMIIAAPAAAACDLDALRTYPMSEVLWSASIPIAEANRLFGDPDHPYDPSDWESRGGPDQVDHDRAALARALAAQEPALRPVLMLSAIAHWTLGDHGIRIFFMYRNGAYLEEVLSALEDHRLTEHADIFRRGAALFGPVYGTPQERYDRWNDGRGTILDPELDTALLALSAEYAALPNLRDIAVDLIAQSEELSTRFATLRRAVDDERRLDHLGIGLWACLADYDTHLAELPPPHRQIVVSYIFESESVDGSLPLFFSRPAGALAPELVTAFREMGLPDHADAMQAAIDLFPTPYPLDRRARRNFMATQGGNFHNPLYELNLIVADGMIREAMIRTADEADILPR